MCTEEMVHEQAVEEILQSHEIKVARALCSARQEKQACRQASIRS